MKNIDVVRAFVSGRDSKSTQHLRIEGNSLINYTTIIARRVFDPEIKTWRIEMRGERFSVTTSRIQSYIRFETPQNLLSTYFVK